MQRKGRNADPVRLARLYRQKALAYKEKFENLRRRTPPHHAEAWFRYTVVLPQREGEPVLVVGSFDVKNTGSESLHDPVVLLRMTPPNTGTFSTRVLDPQWLTVKGVYTARGTPTGWVYVHEDWQERARSDGEYWIRLQGAPPLEPGGWLRVDALQWQLPHQTPGFEARLEGFVYFQEKRDGIAAGNSIAVSF